MSDNNWYEKREMPPVGTVCNIHPSCGKAKITYIGNGVGCYIDLSNGMEYSFSISSFKLLPIKTERELAIEEMCKALAAKGHYANLITEMLGKLYDAGYRKNES